MIRISPSREEIAELKKLRLNRKANTGERAHYVLLAAEGKSAPAIAKQLNRNILTVRQWLKRYLSEGMAGLTSKKQSGRPAKKAVVIAEQMETLLSRSPSEYGYQEAGWQINLLRDWFSRQNCLACENTIVKVLKKKGYVYKRFSKSTPRNAPSAQEKQKAIGALVEAVQTYKSDDREVLFSDESHFSNQPYVSRGWFKQGEKKRWPLRKTG